MACRRGRRSFLSLIHVKIKKISLSVLYEFCAHPDLDLESVRESVPESVPESARMCSAARHCVAGLDGIVSQLSPSNVVASPTMGGGTRVCGSNRRRSLLYTGVFGSVGGVSSTDVGVYCGFGLRRTSRVYHFSSDSNSGVLFDCPTIATLFGSLGSKAFSGSGGET